MSAPLSIRLWACARAASASSNRPPSENESGVTFTTPMTSGLSRENRNLPQRRVNAASRRGGWRGFALRAAVRRRLARRRRAGRLRRPRRLAGHDVGDLLGVERLELEQRRRHRLDLVPVLLEDLAGDRVLLVDDAADLGVDLLHRRLGDVLVRLDRAAEEDLAL